MECGVVPAFPGNQVGPCMALGEKALKASGVDPVPSVAVVVSVMKISA